nr:hypothetical protein pPsy0479a_00076 [Pseudomonas syringae]
MLFWELSFILITNLYSIVTYAMCQKSINSNAIALYTITVNIIIKLFKPKPI